MTELDKNMHRIKQLEYKQIRTWLTRQQRHEIKMQIKGLISRCRQLRAEFKFQNNVDDDALRYDEVNSDLNDLRYSARIDVWDKLLPFIHNRKHDYYYFKHRGYKHLAEKSLLLITHYVDSGRPLWNSVNKGKKLLNAGKYDQTEQYVRQSWHYLHQLLRKPYMEEAQILHAEIAVKKAEQHAQNLRHRQQVQAWIQQDNLAGRPRITVRTEQLLNYSCEHVTNNCVQIRHELDREYSYFKGHHQLKLADNIRHVIGNYVDYLQAIKKYVVGAVNACFRHDFYHAYLDYFKGERLLEVSSVKPMPKSNDKDLAK